MNLSQAAEKAIIDTVCAFTNDRTTLEIARWVKMSPNGRASRHLSHYLAGSGLDMQVSIRELMNGDSGVRATVEQTIRTALRQNPQPGFGVVPLPQPVFHNMEWKNATGSLNMEWTLNQSCSMIPGTSVTLSFRNKYRWHPNEFRITQCVHQAAEDLKVQGAKDYAMVGSPTVWEIPEHGGASGSW